MELSLSSEEHASLATLDSLIVSALGNHSDDVSFQTALYHVHKFLITVHSLPPSLPHGRNAAFSFLKLLCDRPHPSLLSRIISILALLTQKFQFVLESLPLSDDLFDVLSGCFVNVPELRPKIVQLLSSFDFTITDTPPRIISLVLDPPFSGTPLLVAAMVNLFYILSAFPLGWEQSARVLDFLFSVSRDLDPLRLWTVYNLTTQHGTAMQSFLDGTPNLIGFLSEAFEQSSELAHAAIVVFGGFFGARCIVRGFDSDILIAALSHQSDKVKIAACFASVNFILHLHGSGIECDGQVLSQIVKLIISDNESFLVKSEACDGLMALVGNGCVGIEEGLQGTFFAAALAAGKTREEWFVGLLGPILDLSVACGECARFLDLLNEIRNDNIFREFTGAEFVAFSTRIAFIETEIVHSEASHGHKKWVTLT
jgi:hypothetical protein